MKNCKNIQRTFRKLYIKNMNKDHEYSQQYSPEKILGHDYAEYPTTNEEEMGGAEIVTLAAESQQQMVGTVEEIPQEEMVMDGYQTIEMGMSGEIVVEASENENVGKGKPVHQCPVCDKIFVSFKGLQQHAIIHTDQKPYACDICGKAFRFKSNLFEHRSIHTGKTPHQCPICGKTCRLKGNLKKHLRTHCSNREELELAWMPFASNRRAPAQIPQDAQIIRPNSVEAKLFTPLNGTKKRKFGLGMDSKGWVDKIRRGQLLPTVKMKRILEMVKMVEKGSMDMENLFIQARAIPIEKFDCPICKTPFHSRLECSGHIEEEHPNARNQRPHFCEICLRSFVDRQQLAIHQEHHKRVQALLEENKEKISEPMIMMPVLNEADEREKTGKGGGIENIEGDDEIMGEEGWGRA